MCATEKRIRNMEKNPSRSFKDLIVWQKAHQFVLMVYKYSEDFPKSELFGLTSQLRRAAVSVPANIVEGYRKSSKKDKARMMNIAQGSIEECHYYLILSNDLGFGKNQEIVELLNEVSKMLNAYIKTLLSSNS